ncbi:putative lipoprotein YerB [Clostridia bacterium]|nr:putative lipoprotein YerB [Clostridia bacterium]GHU77227.1 putative lipoprotein YerB [Clostridia bacterium]
MSKRILLFVILVVLLFTSCKKNEASSAFSNRDDINVITNTPEIKDEPEEPPKVPERDLTGLAVDNLTGDYIKEDVAARRPVAVVINNLKKALPQSGISQADIFYEVLAEGDITRIIAVFKDFDSPKIGTVRSARDYFITLAGDTDAIFVHFGGSPQAYSDIKSKKTDNLDGMRDGAFWRDPERFAQKGMYEHSAYTSAEKIFEYVTKKGYRTGLKNNDGLFEFFDEFSYPDGGTLTDTVTVPFSPAYTSVFKYDHKTNLFEKYNGTTPHIDEETGEILKVSNIIIQSTKMWVINNDSAGRREVKLVSSGKGYLVTGGEYTEITWEKTAADSPTKYYDAKGNKLTLNKGKTWICIFQDNGTVTFE